MPRRRMSMLTRLMLASMKAEEKQGLRTTGERLKIVRQGWRVRRMGWEGWGTCWEGLT